MGIAKRKREEAATRWRIVGYLVVFLMAGAVGWLGMLLLT